MENFPWDTTLPPRCCVAQMCISIFLINQVFTKLGNILPLKAFAQKHQKTNEEEVRFENLRNLGNYITQYGFIAETLPKMGLCIPNFQLFEFLRQN